MYTYAGTSPTTHPKLYLILPGANDFTGFTDPEVTSALGTAGTQGLLAGPA